MNTRMLEVTANKRAAVRLPTSHFTNNPSKMNKADGRRNYELMSIVFLWTQGRVSVDKRR